MTNPNVPENPDGGPDADDRALAAAGERLRQRSRSLSAASIETSVLRRRTRRLGIAAGGAFAAVVLLAGILVFGDGDDADIASPVGSGVSAADRDDAEELLAGLDAQPVDPTEIQLVSSVSTFADCGDLISNLRQVGAEHVGSRGFGAGEFGPFMGDGYASTEAGMAVADEASPSAPGAANDSAGGVAPDGTTLGTNVQVVGVDELDHVKAVGSLIYDLDGDGNLRITDADTLEVVSSVELIPPSGDEISASVHQLLVAGDRVAVFGSESEMSDPVEGDPSATRSSTSFMTVTFVDASDAAAPVVTDRVRIEGRLVSARLVDGEVRLVTTSDMADLGFVMPTTPTSIAKALEQNRRSVALSQVEDWIPDWQRDGDEPAPVVPCERVHVPDTFAGVAMTSMVTFPIGDGTFDPTATSILAPGDTLYAGLDTVAISSGVWVDPIDRGRLDFDDWQTAVHRFSFAADTAPAYEGSGIVDGSTIGQFAFGEIGDSLAVVTTTGTPWAQDLSTNAVDLVVLTADGSGTLEQTAGVEDLADGAGMVSAVRFVDGRVLVSTGVFGETVRVVDVSDPASPRKAGNVTLPGPIGYFHPLPDDRALLIGSRSDLVGSGQERRTRPWVQAHLLDTSDPDAPAVISTWERQWSSDQVGSDHHAFTYWPERGLAMWGLHTVHSGFGVADDPNNAAVLRVDDEVSEVALPVANKPNAVPAPCPEVDVTGTEAEQIVASGGTVLRCDSGHGDELEWPRYQCYRVDDGMVRRVDPDAPDGDYFVCNPAPQPTVSRVLVVNGRPILLTDQTLEALDPETFASTAIAYHPGGSNVVYR